MISRRQQTGFTLIELMISLVLGLLISSAIIQVMVSNNMTERLNRAMGSAQENGRFIISRLRSELLMTGRYDTLQPTLNTDVDTVVEAAFVQNNPVIAVGDFANAATKGSVEGASGANDILMVGFQGLADCSASKHSYLSDEEFYVVNEYFVENNTLKCIGYDGRVLRGLKSSVTTSSAYSILDDVYSFQVQYGVTDTLASQDNSARPVKFIDADTLSAEKASGAQVVALRLAILLKADSEISIDPVPSFKLFSEDAIQPSEQRLFKQFETTITLRNSKNFIRSRNI